MKITNKIFWFLSIALLLLSCTEDRLDNIADNRYTTEAFKNSNIRIVNLGGSNQAIVNGDTLTNFVVIPPLEQKQYPSTKYFPTDGRLHTIWNFPQDLLGKDNTAFVEIKARNYTGLPNEHKFIVKDNGYPTDYYTLANDAYTQGLQKVIEIPRNIEAPSKPEYCKVRLINLSEKAVRNEDLEELYGPLSLAWADGMIIDDKLKNVGIGEVSEYVEIPYGTYQLKVLTEEGKQLPAEGSPLLDQRTSTMCLIQNNKIVPTYLTYSPIVSLKPGGIYTVIAYAGLFDYPQLVNLQETDGNFQNGFKIISDIDEPINSSFSRIQFVNALPEEGSVSLKVNNLTTEEISFGEYSEYISVVRGKQKIEANSTNNVLASIEYDAKAGDNYTVWLFRTASGKDTLVVSHNNLSGVALLNIESSTQDARDERSKSAYFSDLRFFNFNSDYPNVTFTSDNGQPFKVIGFGYNASATEQLTTGSIPSINPVIKYWAGNKSISGYSQKFLTPTNILLYKSTETTVPGVWAEEVLPISTSDLITRPELYDIRDGKPVFDVGSYSIALVGKQSDDEKYKSKMIIVKHTK